MQGLFVMLICVLIGKCYNAVFLHKLGFIYGLVFIEISSVCFAIIVKKLVVAQDLQRRLRQVSTKCR